MSSAIRQSWSKRSRFYDDSYFKQKHVFAKRDKYARELEKISDALQPQPNQWLLDIGCSSGVAQQYFQDRFGCRVVGLDFYPAGLKMNPQRGRILQADAHQLPFPDNFFDGIYLLHVLGHVLAPAQVLSEVYRVLRPSGRVAAITPNRWFVYALRPLNWLRVISYSPDPTVLRYYSAKRLEQEFGRSGLRVESLRFLGAFPDYLRSLEGGGRADFLRERLLIQAVRAETRSL